VQDHRAALGRLLKRGQALPQGQLIRQLTPLLRGWATYDRVGVSHAVYARRDHLTWGKRRPNAGDTRGNPPLGPSGGMGIASAPVSP
jgi:hypothetical protein